MTPTPDTSLAAERNRNARWLLRLRCLAAAGAFFTTAPFAGSHVQARALAPILAVGLVQTLALVLLARRYRVVLRYAFFVIPCIDIPSLLVVEWISIHSDRLVNPAAAGAGFMAETLVAIIITLFSLETRTVVLTAIVGIVGQLVSWILFQRYISNVFTVMMIIVGAAIAAVQLTRRLRTLLREKDEALSQLRANLVKVTAEFQPGRLTGISLDGKYVLEEMLGRGGMGEVYRARDDGGREVAIKVLFAHVGDDTGAVERFEREAKIARKLPDDRVAPVREMAVSRDGLHYLVMDLLRGEDLGALLRRRMTLSLTELLPIVDELCEALAAAHALGIVHRDLKPGNVFLVADAQQGAVRLLDFGIARVPDSDTHAPLTSTSMMVGTPGYLAPEQVAPRLGAVGPATDLFALGALVYRALTGEPAFAAKNAAQAAYAALNVQPPPPSKLRSDVPGDVDDVIALALAKRLAHRYHDARMFARDLRAAALAELGDDVRARARRARADDDVAEQPTLASK